MRKALVSVAVALAGVAALAAAAWQVQAQVLPGPEPAAQAALRADHWLHAYRLSIVVFHARDHRFKGACLRSWYIQPHSQGRSRYWHGHKDGSLLLVSHRLVALATGSGRVVLAFGHHLDGTPTSLAAAIGCTKSIGDELIAAAQSGGRLSLERAYAANQPALALELHSRLERLTVYLSAHDYRPLVVIGAEAGHIATARLYLTRLTPAEATRFRHVLGQKGIPLPH